MKVRDLKGYDSLRALWAYHKLLLGLKMLPAYMAETYEEFYSRVEEMPEKDKEKLIREAALFVDLEDHEVKALIIFCSDPNGIPYREENMKGLGPDQLFEIIVAVCIEISKIRIDFVSESEKKNSKTSA